MIKIISKIYLVISVILISLGILLVFFYLKTKPTKSKDSNKKYYKNRKKRLKKLNLNSDSKLYRIIDDFLKESGYVFYPENYILLHLIVLLLIIYGIFSLGFDSASKSIIPVSILILVILNLLVFKKGNDRKNEIRLELCDIQDVMYFQNKIGTSEDVILTYASKISKGPLKEPLEYLAAAPKVKKSIDNGLEELRQISNVVELQSFSFILQQRKETGNVLENHKAQSQMMKRNKRLRRKIHRSYKRTRLVVASLMLFSCYVLLLTVPILAEMFRSLDLLFR